MLQCSGQSCGSSGSQTIVSEAAVEYNQTDTLELDPHKQIPCFCCYGNDNSSSARCQRHFKRPQFKSCTSCVHWPTHVPFACIYIPSFPGKKFCIKPCPPTSPTISPPLTPFTRMKPIFSPHTLSPTIPQSHIQLVKCKGIVGWAWVSECICKTRSCSQSSQKLLWMKQYGQLIVKALR